VVRHPALFLQAEARFELPSPRVMVFPQSVLRFAGLGKNRKDTRIAQTPGNKELEQNSVYAQTRIALWTHKSLIALKTEKSKPGRPPPILYF
jgi:hypothetical protein